VHQKSKQSKEAELKALDQAISERKKYQKQQETAIAELVEAGNTKLLGLSHDILLAEKQLRELKTDIRTAARDKRLLTEDLEAMQREATSLSGGNQFIQAMA
jgi:hypothetical protein